MCSPIRILVSESADVKAITSATALKSVVSPQVMTLQSAECAVMLWRVDEKQMLASFLTSISRRPP